MKRYHKNICLMMIGLVVLLGGCAVYEAPPSYYHNSSYPVVYEAYPEYPYYYGPYYYGHRHHWR